MYSSFKQIECLDMSDTVISTGNLVMNKKKIKHITLMELLFL